MKPDPDNMNNKRAARARRALTVFQGLTKTDDCDAVADLLTDLMHLMDRCELDTTFDLELERARRNYESETTEEEA